ncbi:hypothetical protein B0H10DRAFT_2220152 [Mycena sp. CBHHK59/15]|nr:hypothetical protein B0H10DRAFT_2225124 [Mycena sp. CBHHK59/15]KAJ6615673.1 hypothetical protein B0H10DRAFT_2220152 [Mycena sp. CBHHK59/15]
MIPGQTAIVASVQEQHRALIQRTLHPNELTSSSGLSATSTTTTSPSRRKSGNPRPYSRSAATLPILDDFALPSAVTSVKLTVAILPKVLDTSDHNDTLDPSPRYTWKGGDDLEKAQLSLKRANLVFVVDVNVTGPIFETIDSAFQAHCQTHNISYVAASTAAGSVETPNTKSWVLLGPRGHSGARTWVEDPKCLTRFTFTLLALRNIPFSYTPNYLREETSTDLSTACSISPPVSRIMFWFTPAWLVGFLTRFWLPLMATLILCARSHPYPA